MPIGRTRKVKQQPMETIPASSAIATETVSDEEGNTSECSHRHTSSNYSTLESSSGNANFYTQQPSVISNQPTSSSLSPDKYHTNSNSNSNQNSHLNATEIDNVK